MAATLGVETIKHTNGTTAVTVGTNGSVTAAGGISATTGTFNGTGGQITTDNSGHITSKQSLDVATAGGRFIGNSNRGQLGHVAIEQTANSTDGGYIRFATSASGSTSPTDRMRIDGTGNVGIGLTSPQELLHLKDGDIAVGNGTAGNNAVIGRIGFSTDASNSRFIGIESFRGSDAANADLRFHTYGGDGDKGERMRITYSGQFVMKGIADDTTSDGANINVRTSDGLVRRSTSSRRYKNTIEDATHGLKEVLTLRPVTYKGNNDGDTLFGGLIAEEVHDAGLTEFVDYDSENRPDALRYPHMISLCIKAVQELSKKNDALEARLAALEA